MSFRDIEGGENVWGGRDLSYLLDNDVTRTDRYYNTKPHVISKDMEDFFKEVEEEDKREQP